MRIGVGLILGKGSEAGRGSAPFACLDAVGKAKATSMRRKPDPMLDSERRFTRSEFPGQQQFERLPAPKVFGTATRGTAVFRQASCHIRGDARVQRTVLAAHEVDEPRGRVGDCGRYGVAHGHQHTSTMAGFAGVRTAASVANPEGNPGGDCATSPAFRPRRTPRTSPFHSLEP